RRPSQARSSGRCSSRPVSAAGLTGHGRALTCRAGRHTSDVSDDIVGRPVNAVLVPPQAERFASLVGVDLGRLVLNVPGWNNLVLLDSDRVFLFPRAAAGVEWFERELAAYQALARTRLSIVPRLLGRWQGPGIYPFPF